MLRIEELRERGTVAAFRNIRRLTGNGTVRYQFYGACFYLFSWRLMTTTTLCHGYQTSVRPRQLEVL
jgi:hypothetical protein